MNIYGLLIGIGIVIGIELIKKFNKEITYLNILFMLLLTLIGARTLFLLHNIYEIKSGLINPIAIWDGGLAFYGGIIGLIVSILIISKYKKISFFKLTDSVFLFLPLIHSIGRIGNFFNYELYGKPTSLPWGIYIPKEYRDIFVIESTHFHPVFAYESILNILNFLLLIFLKNKVKKEGILTAIYLINYSIIRLLMNTLRVDKEYFLQLETSDIFSVILLMSGILILILTMKNDIKNIFAKIISRVLTILLLLSAVISVLLNTDVTFNIKLLLGLFTFVVPILSMILLKVLGITSDLNVTKREERPKLFLPMGICFLISLVLSINSSSQILITVYTSLVISFVMGFLITLFWKISYHMIWSTLAIFFIIYSWQIPQLYYLLLLLPFIGWSRLHLKRHTLGQVIAGFLLTSLCILSVLTLIKF